MSDGNGNVTFTTKELLGRIDEKLDRLNEKLDLKVDRGEFVELAGRVNEFERHGSAQAVEALDHLREYEKRLGEVERVQIERAHLGDVVEGDHGRIDGLEAWRNRLLGMVTFAGGLGGVAVALASHYI